MGVLESIRGWHLVAIGVLLLLSPFALNAVSVGGYTHHYRVGYVETTDDGYNWSGGHIFGVFDEDVLCWGSMSRTCQLERSLLDGPLPVERGTLYYERYSDYSYVYANDSFYKPENTGSELRLREVSQSTVFERVAGHISTLPEQVQTALEAEEATVSAETELPSNTLLSIQEGRYAIVEHDYRTQGYLDEILTTVRPALGVLGFVSGLGLVLLGQRLRVYHR